MAIFISRHGCRSESLTWRGFNRQAANAFKLEKLMKESGDAFTKEADCRDKQGERDEAANAWWNAAKSVRSPYFTRSAENRTYHWSALLQYKRGYPERTFSPLSTLSAAA
jgi:hypothetical protein